MKDFLYITISAALAEQIREGVLKAGDRLPSVRELCRLHGIGMNTAKRVFLELEAQSLIASRPQSGYFVRQAPYSRPPLPGVSRPSATRHNKEPAQLIQKVYAAMGKSDVTPFSIGVPSGTLLPTARLNKALLHAARELGDGGIAYDPLEGNLQLRRTIAARSLAWGGRLRETDLLTTAGGMSALSLCMMALGKPGDTIAIESPCYPGILQLAVSLGLKVLELPAHPVTGVDLPALKKAIPKIDLCLLVPNFNTPLGSCMPDGHKQEVVRLLAHHNIPLIEDDIYGDLYFGAQRPKCCKTFDEAGNVLWCGSVSKTLAPGYRVGWVAAGRYHERLARLKLVHALSGTAVTQQAVAHFMNSGRYEQHLRRLRQTLQENGRLYTEAIAAYFPEGTKVSRPQGGLTLWVELGGNVDTTDLFGRALKRKISISPGRMFSLQEQYNNCLRLSLGLPWSEKVAQQLKLLGKLAATG